MRKLPILAANLLAAGLVLSGSLAAQTSAATTQSAPAAKTHATAHKSATAGKSAAPLALTTQKEKISYALGMSIGMNTKRQEVDIDPNIVARGLKDVLSGGKTLMTEEEAHTVIGQEQAELRKHQQEKMAQAGEENRKAGVAFMDANKTKEGVVALPSGLQYKILKEGTGPKPASTDTVVCNYRGTLINGTEFDSSYKRGEPTTFPVNGVIKGWSEALQLMPVGSKWELFVPPDLAYGERGAGPDIGPNATLIFEVELLSIKGRTPDQNAAPPTNDEKPHINE
ncbi:MAG TPA: FKBP-type peptidyl-prolyl cis-trans isomerase [Candidatus Aquilonibacter sp.]|nr:FKBP-type peptidyl-prolyl cis-trans isomerase [Candidatus Aquilonibacter sp.]